MTHNYREKLVALLGLLAALFLGGCRLYEPQRYTRLAFAPDAPRTRVLFVGNSMTYYNDLPGLVQQLSAREDRPAEIASLAQPYVSLQWHYDTGKPQALFAQQKWDCVVLQEFSRRPVTDPQNSQKYFALLAAAARQAGARPLIFQNWTRTGHQGEYDAMLATYQTVQTQTAGTIAPVGAAWQLCARDHPEIKLFVDDRHPTDEGTYLTACVLYGTIYAKFPTSLPPNLTGPNLPLDRLLLLRQLATTALRESAH